MWFVNLGFCLSFFCNLLSLKSCVAKISVNWKCVSIIKHKIDFNRNKFVHWKSFAFIFVFIRIYFLWISNRKQLTKKLFILSVKKLVLRPFPIYAPFGCIFDDMLRTKHSSVNCHHKKHASGKSAEVFCEGREFIYLRKN